MSANKLTSSETTTDDLPVRMSFVCAIGETTSIQPDVVLSNATLISTRTDAELIVVDDCGPEPIRALLAARRGNCRVLHANPAYGTNDALVLGAKLAEGDIIVLLAPDVELSTALFEQILSRFESDSGIGVVTAPMTYRELPAGWPPPAVPPFLALRRAALMSIGGLGALAAVPSNDDDSLRTPLLSEVPLGALRFAKWRTAEVESTLSHTDGLVEYWTRHSANIAKISSRLYWSPPFLPERETPGLNIIGLLEAACGVGEAGRRYVEAISAANISHTTFSYHGHNSPDFAFIHHQNRTLSYDTNLLALNPDLLPSFSVRAGRELWLSNRYSIGLWFWELEKLSPVVCSGFSYVNELWASSRFMRDTFAAATDRPVVFLPLPIAREEGTPHHTRQDLHLPTEFCFLTVFDFGSLAMRKNGLGVVQAFCEAFAPGEGPVLVLKTLNASWDQHGAQQLWQAIGDRRDVLVLDGYLSDAAINDLIGLCNCYVSLHRAEGFGLSLAQAMAWGRPVVATAYSGNLDFMTRENSYLVGAQKAPVPTSLSSIYPRGSVWAEPNMREAARIMREVYENQSAAHARGLVGQRDIRRTHGVATVAGAIRDRFQEVSELRRRARKAATEAPALVHSKGAHR